MADSMYVNRIRGMLAVYDFYKANRTEGSRVSWGDFADQEVLVVHMRAQTSHDGVYPDIIVTRVTVVTPSVLNVKVEKTTGVGDSMRTLAEVDVSCTLAPNWTVRGDPEGMEDEAVGIIAHIVWKMNSVLLQL